MFGTANTLNFKRLIGWTICLCIVCCVNSVEAQQNIELVGEVQAKHSMLTLGDLATLTGSTPRFRQSWNQVVLYPAPTQSTRFTRAQIAEELAMRGMDVSTITFSGARSVLVVPVQDRQQVARRVAMNAQEATYVSEPQAPIGQSAIGQSAIEAAKDKVSRLVRAELTQNANQDAEWVIDSELDNQAVLALLDPQVKILGLSGIRRPWVGEFKAVIRLAVDQQMRQLQIPVSIRCDTLAVSVATNIASNQIIRANDLTLAPVLKNESPTGGDLFYQLEEVVGMQARRSMRAGQFIRASMIQTPRVIERGERVLVTVAVGRMRVKRYGTAEDEGGMGDVIPVRFESRGGLSHGRIVGAGAVEINLAGQQAYRQPTSRR